MNKKLKDAVGKFDPKNRPDAGGAPKEGGAPKKEKALKNESPIEPTKTVVTPFDTERIEVETIDRSDWQELTGETGDKPEPFPMMALPKEARDFCEAVSSSMGTPQDFAALGILGAMACAIGASTRLEVKAGWQEFAVLWLALCARPGAAKSPSLNACFKPIRGIQQELNLKHSQAMNAYREKMAQAKKDPIAEVPVKPVAEFLLLGDVTQEALVRTLNSTLEFIREQDTRSREERVLLHRPRAVEAAAPRPADVTPKTDTQVR